jgi:hypothetical protein
VAIRFWVFSSIELVWVRVARAVRAETLVRRLVMRNVPSKITLKTGDIPDWPA